MQLEVAGCTLIDISHDFLYHIPHGDSIRTQLKPFLEQRKNARFVQVSEPWNKSTDAFSCTFSTPQPGQTHCVCGDPFHIPFSFKQLMYQPDYDGAIGFAFNEVAHKYVVSRHQGILVLGLFRGNLTERINILASAFLVCLSLSDVYSMILLTPWQAAEKSNRDLVITWEPSMACVAQFPTVFDMDLALPRGTIVARTNRFWGTFIHLAKPQLQYDAKSPAVRLSALNDLSKAVIIGEGAKFDESDFSLKAIAKHRLNLVWNLRINAPYCSINKPIPDGPMPNTIPHSFPKPDPATTPDEVAENVVPLPPAEEEDAIPANLPPYIKMIPKTGPTPVKYVWIPEHKP